MGYSLLVIAYMALLYYLSSLPPKTIASVWPWKIPDYALHGAAYAGLGLVLYLALTRGARWTPGKAAGVGWVIAMVYGVADEYHQSFVPGRHPSVQDLVADGVGAGLTLLIALALAKRQRRPKT